MPKPMLSLFKSARNASVPIVAIRTADQFATQSAIATDQEEYPLVQWDAANGLSPLNDAAKKLLAGVELEIGFSDAIAFAVNKLPRTAVMFVHNAHRHLTSSEPSAIAANVQALASSRDKLKLNFRMIVLLAPYITFPSELEHDVILLDDALPGPDELAQLVTELYASAKQRFPALEMPTKELLGRAVDALSGLSFFEAEQVTAMSLTETGLDVTALWDRKVVSIQQVRGLSVYRGGETFNDLRGLQSAKDKLRARITAKKPLGVVVWIDEGSDVFANVEHDTSGVKTDQQRALLVEMEANGWPGVIFTGVPGSGKSALARAFGAEAGVPTIALDFGDMEAPHVGESEALLRQAIKTIKAVGRGNAFFVLTCNSLAGIRPQFMRRFKKGVYFFDMPTTEERDAIWKFYLEKFELPTQKRPNDDGWTGAEIRECCEEAWDVNTTLVEAAKSIIPVSQSRGDVINEMRKAANGRFLDASKSGTYTFDPKPMAKVMRAIALPQSAGNMKES